MWHKGCPKYAREPSLDVCGEAVHTGFDLLKLLIDQRCLVTRVQSTRRLARTVSVRRNCTTQSTGQLLCST